MSLPEPLVLNAQVFSDFCAMLPPEELSKIYREFLQSTRERASLLRRTADPKAVRGEAHALRGTAGMLGAGVIMNLASLLEDHADQPDRIAANLQALDQAVMDFQATLLGVGVPV